MKTRLLGFPMLLIGLLFYLTSGCEEASDKDDNNIIPDTTDTTQHGGDTALPAGWKKVGDLNANNMIWSLVCDGSGNIYAGGYFTNSQGYRYVARWDGHTWSELGSLKANEGIFALTVDASGKVFAVGSFTNGATPTGGTAYVARWDGSSWTDIGGGGGTSLSSDKVGNVYKERWVWNGSDWSLLCPACSLGMAPVYSLISNPGGTLRYAGGQFAHDNGYRYVAVCDGGNCWQDLGQLNANADIQVLTLDGQGNIYAAGAFTDGNLPTTGSCYVARWNGYSWNELGHLGANQPIYYLVSDPVHGYIYASGYFTNSKGESFVAKWDGSAWSDLGNLRLAPSPIIVDQSGKLYAVTASFDGKRYDVVVYE